MENSFLIILNIVCTAAVGLLYFNFKTFSDKKLNTINDTLKAQSALISDFEKYKSLMNIDDFKKMLELQLEKQRLELDKDFNGQMAAFVQSIDKRILKALETTNWEAMEAFEEIAQVPLNIILKDYPTAEDKSKRDEFIAGKFPISAKFLVPIADAILRGEIKKEGEPPSHKQNPTV